MVISLTMQFKLILYSTLAGIFTGLLFDFYRTIRGFEKILKILLIIEDILFWILSAIVIFIFLLYTNYAFMTMYVYLYIILGIFLYMKLFSKIVTSIQYNIIKFLGKFIRIFINYSFYPLKLLAYLINPKK
jgi:spore cortex biosynthesis protein YabQ